MSTALRNSITGQIAVVPNAEAASLYGPEWAEVPAPPAPGWTWNNAVQAWAPPPPPRVWELRLFITELLTPLEFLTIRVWQPANPAAPSPDDLTFMWAREVILTVPRVNLDDPNTAAVLGMCVARNLITAERAAQVIAGLPFA